MNKINKHFSLIILLSFSKLFAQTNFSVKGFHHIESLVTDGKNLYAADIGKELNPTAKDSDGKIYKLDLKGNILDSSFSKVLLHAPKGIAISNKTLILTDIDKVIALDIQTGKSLYEISFSDGISFLNDIAIVNKTTLFVSATDKSKIYKVNLVAKTYEELLIDIPISGTNGLFYEKKSNRLYVNGMGSDNKPNGIFGFIDLNNNKFTRLTNNQGLFDGIWVNKNVLYVSNWVAFEKKGIIHQIDLKTNKTIEIILSEPIAGPADFTIYKNQLIIPEMLSGSILFMNLK